MTRTTATISPRDLACVSGLRERGLSLVEVKISSISPWQHHQLRDVPLPGDTRVLCIMRGEQVFMSDCESVSLNAGDVLVVMTRDVASVRHQLTGPTAIMLPNIRK